MMKMFEILWELPKCDTEKQSEQILLEKCTNRLAQHRVAINLQFGEKQKKQKKITPTNIFEAH